jgi:hypothetical protein
VTEQGTGDLEPLARRVRALENRTKRVPDLATDVAWRAALTGASVVALGLPFLWDHTSSFSDRPYSAGIAGWHVLFYGLNDKSHLDLWVRVAPFLVIVAVLASLAVVREGRGVALAVIALDLLVIVALFVAAARGDSSAGDSGFDEQRTGPGSGLWVCILLLVGWIVMCGRRIQGLGQRS